MRVHRLLKSGKTKSTPSGLKETDTESDSSPCGELGGSESSKKSLGRRVRGFINLQGKSNNNRVARETKAAKKGGLAIAKDLLRSRAPLIRVCMKRFYKSAAETHITEDCRQHYMHSSRESDGEDNSRKENYDEYEIEVDSEQDQGHDNEQNHEQDRDREQAQDQDNELNQEQDQEKGQDRNAEKKQERDQEQNNDQDQDEDNEEDQENDHKEGNEEQDNDNELVTRQFNENDLLQIINQDEEYKKNIDEVFERFREQVQKEVAARNMRQRNAKEHKKVHHGSSRREMAMDTTAVDEILDKSKKRVSNIYSIPENRSGFHAVDARSELDDTLATIDTYSVLYKTLMGCGKDSDSSFGDSSRSLSYSSARSLLLNRSFADYSLARTVSELTFQPNPSVCGLGHPNH